MFEAVHGSAPDIAGKHIANPCALMLGAAMMLAHLGMVEQAGALRRAIVAAIVSGDRTTPDLGGTDQSEAFTDSIIDRLRA
jgi:isocitrate dehydrogenase (NAD+)